MKSLYTSPTNKPRYSALHHKRIVRVASLKNNSSERLFSNLNPTTQKHEPGSVLGSAALVAGTAVGAGILALPAVTKDAGFAASSVALTATCGFSIITGLLIAEVTINTLCELGASRGISIGTLAKRTLGDTGGYLVSATYLLLHYSLLVAYIAKAGETIMGVTQLSPLQADAVFVAAVGGLCYIARPKVLDNVNSALVVGVVATFLGLLATAASDVEPSLLLQADWDKVPSALPVIALAFVYQNVVPVITSSLEGDVKKIRMAIVAGVALPWLMFLTYDAAVLGNPAVSAATGSIDPLAALRSQGPEVSALVDGFSLLAIITSFIGFVLGLSEFIADALSLPADNRKTVPYLLTLGPPFVLALTFPGLFFKALDFAGTYGVLVLFGLIPAAMVWRERYNNTTLTRDEIVPGGKGVLILVVLLAGGIILDQIFIG